MFRVEAVDTTKLVLSRVETKDEESAFQTANGALQEELRKRQEDIEALKQKQQDILNSMNDSTPEQVEEPGELLKLLAAQISTHVQRVRELQARRVIRFECTEVKETLELPPEIGRAHV